MMGHEKLIRSKTSFYFGVAVGVAAISLIGFLLFLGLYLKAQFATGEAGINDTIPVVKDSGAAKAPPAGNGAGNDAAISEIKINKNDQVRGNKNAKVTIVVFSDIQCPFCTRYHETMLQVMKNYPNDVKMVFKHFPLDSIHPFARKAAEASECAGEQGKFAQYIDNLFANQASINAEYLSSSAKTLGLNTSKFDSCLSSGKMAAKVEADLKQGQSLGVRGTPGSFINGKSVPGAVPYTTIDGMIKEALK